MCYTANDYRLAVDTLNQDPYKDSEKIPQVVFNYYKMRNTSKIALKKMMQKIKVSNN